MEREKIRQMKRVHQREKQEKSVKKEEPVISKNEEKQTDAVPKPYSYD